MPRAPLPLLALLTLQCSGDGQDNTGFAGSTPTSAGPSSFGDSTTDTPTTTDATASTTTTTTDPTTTSSTTTTTDPTTTTATTEAPPACGDGTVDDGEQCDDANPNNDDACLSDCTAGHALLVLVARGDAPAAIATHTPGPGWTVTDATYDISAAELEPTPDGAMAVLRRAGADPNAKDELWFARWLAPDPDLLKTANKVGDFGFTLDAPSLAATGDAVTLAFLGTDNKHYTAQYTNSAWSAFTPLPASMLQIQAFGPSAATLAPGEPALHAVYAGDDDKVYVARRPTPSDPWDASVLAPPPAVIDTIRPAAIVLPNGDLVIAYVRNSDGRIGVTQRSLADNTWSLETQPDPTALASALTLVHTDAGALVLAWRDADDPGIHYATGAAHDAWDPPVTVEVPASSSAPVLTPGALGADAELFYMAAGALHHARILAEDNTPPEPVAAIDDATAVAAARVQRVP